MILPEDLEEFIKAVNYLVDNSENRLGHIVHRIRRKDGAIRKLDEYVHLIHSDDFGEVCFVFSIDITEYGYGAPETDVDGRLYARYGWSGNYKGNKRGSF